MQRGRCRAVELQNGLSHDFSFPELREGAVNRKDTTQRYARTAGEEPFLSFQIEDRGPLSLAFADRGGKDRSASVGWGFIADEWERTNSPATFPFRRLQMCVVQKQTRIAPPVKSPTMGTHA